MAKKTSQKRDLVKSNAGRQTKANQGEQKGSGTGNASRTKDKSDPGALRGFSDVEAPQQGGRRLKTAAKSGYANLIPKSVKK